LDRESQRRATGYGASLLKVFWPYLDWNTVFDNSRVVAELGETPAKFSTYAVPLLNIAAKIKFQFPPSPGLPLRARKRIAAAGELAHDGLSTRCVVSALIEITRLWLDARLGKRWTPGEKLRLLFAGLQRQPQYRV